MQSYYLHVSYTPSHSNTVNEYANFLSCGHHFCYVCGEPWRTCRCAIWYEHRLILGADQEVNDQDPAPADNPVQRVVAPRRDFRMELWQIFGDAIFDRVIAEGDRVEEQEEEEEEEEENEEDVLEEEVTEGNRENEADELSEQEDDESDVVFMGCKPRFENTQVDIYPLPGPLSAHSAPARL